MPGTTPVIVTAVGEPIVCTVDNVCILVENVPKMCASSEMN